MLSEEEIVTLIAEKSGLQVSEVTERVEAKEAEFAGLVSRLGAAYIVGKELGVDLVKPVSKDLKLKNVVPGMRNVTFVAKIVEVGQLRKFESDDGEGAVLNIILGDESGFVRLSLWDDKAREAVDKLAAGQVWQVIGGYALKDSFGNVEVRLGKWGNLKRVEADIKVAEKPKQLKRTKGEYRPARLDELIENDFVEVKAHIIHINQREPVLYFCPSCRSRVDAAVRCAQHKEAEPDRVLIVSGVADDGYGTCGVVFFRDAAESLVSKKVLEIESLVKQGGNKAFADLLDAVVGEQFRMWGVVRKNKLTGALECVVHKLKKISPKEEAATLLAELDRNGKVDGEAGKAYERREG